MHTNGLAFEAGILVIHHGPVLHHQPRGGEVVLVGEVHGLLAVFVDGHRRQGGVDFLHFEGRNQTIELTLDPLTLDLHLRAQRIADVIVKTSDFSIRGLGGKRRIRCFNPQAQGFLGGEKAGRRQQTEGQTTDEGEFLHIRFLASCCWFGKSEE
ncbi:hypothetical protein D3C80_1367990 [compost metagenome]